MALVLHLALWVSLVSLSTSELLIDVQPNVILEELTPKLVINCSISNNQVKQIDNIKSLSLARYNENIKEFEVLLVLEAATLNLTQLVQFRRSQISSGNLYIILTLEDPTQSDARVYRCNVNGDTANMTNISLVNKKEVKYETVSTTLLEEIRRLKKIDNEDRCSSKKEEIIDDKTRISKLSFVGSSEVIKEFVEPLTLTCSVKISNKNADQNYVVRFLYIIHETNGVIEAKNMNQFQPIVTTNAEVDSKNVSGEHSDNELRGSYIEASWSSMKVSESGKYFCGAHIINSEGKTERLNEMLTITVKHPTFEDLVNVIHKLLTQANEDRESCNNNKENIKNVLKDLIEEKQNIKRIKQDLETQHQDVVRNQQDINTEKQNIIRINKELENKEQKIINIYTDLDNKQHNITSIKQDLETQKQNIIRINTDLNATEKNIIRMNKDWNAEQQNITSIKHDLDTQKQYIVRFNKDLNATGHNIIRVNKYLDAKQQNITSIKQELDIQKHNLIRMNQDLDVKKQNITNIQQDCESTKNNLNLYQQNMSILKQNLETKFFNLSTALKEVKQQVDKGTLDLSCEADFYLVKDGPLYACIWSSKVKMNYFDARNECKAKGSHLITLKTLAKFQLLIKIDTTRYLWIGLNDIDSENTFRWEDDKSICDITCQERIFAKGEPNNDKNEDCVAFYSPRQIVNDNDCNILYHYICEKPL